MKIQKFFITFFCLSLILTSCGGSGENLEDQLRNQMRISGNSACDEINQIFDRSLERHITATEADAPRLYKQTIQAVIDDYRLYLRANKQPEVKSVLENIEQKFNQRLLSQSHEELEVSRNKCVELGEFAQAITPFRNKEKVSEKTYIKDVYRTFLDSFGMQLDTFSGYSFPSEGTAEDSHAFGVRLNLKQEDDLAKVSDSVEVFSTIPSLPQIKPGDQISDLYFPKEDLWRSIRQILSDEDLGTWGLKKFFYESTSAEIKIRLNSDKKEIVLSQPDDQQKMPLARAGMIGENILYAELLNFHAGAANDLRRALIKAKATTNEIRGIILDMRHNSGGQNDEAIEIASLFVKEGPLYKERRRNEVETFYSTSESMPDSYGFFSEPLIILVNRFSTSNGELIPLSIRDAGRALIMGEKTFGKGTGLFVFSLSMGSILGGSFQLTTDLSFGRSGTTPQERGLTPDIIVRDKAYLELLANCERDNSCDFQSIQETSKQRNSPIVPYDSILPFGDRSKENSLKEWILRVEQSTENKREIKSEDVVVNKAIEAIYLARPPV